MPGRIAAKVDRNQAEIVAALRQVGATVQHLHTVGQGCPDLLVGFRGVNYLLEVKSSGGCFTPDEQAWHQAWSGEIHIVYSARAALQVIGALAG
jgi:hypothetical protein